MKYLNEKIIEFLEGTCKSPYEAARSLGISEFDIDWAYVEAYIKQCDGCGWWYPVNEIASHDGEVICFSCEAEGIDS